VAVNNDEFGPLVELYGWHEITLISNLVNVPVAEVSDVVAPLNSPELSQLRRRLRGLPHPTLLHTLQEQLDAFPCAALAADNTGRYVAANISATELTGYSRDELMQMSVKDLTPPMRHGATSDLWSKFIQTGTQVGEYLLMRKDGTPVGVKYEAYASVAPGVHLSVLTALEMPSSI
jgi:PAS domain S-box-containing protein